MENEELKAAFEEASTEMLQTAYDFVDHGEDVETIWIYMSMENGWVTTGTAYRISGQIYRGHEVDRGLKQPVGAMENQDDLVDPIAEKAFEFNLQYEDPKDAPTRIIIGYDVIKQALEADFNYDPIARDEDEDWGTVMDRWMENLKNTGVAKA